VWSDAITVTQTNAYITAPRVALLTDGSPLVSWGVSSDSQQIFIAHFEDPGFASPVDAAQEPYLFGFGGYDMAVWNDHVFVVFEKIGGGIFLSASTDGGQQFSAPIAAQVPLPGVYSGLSAVTVDAAGNPVVCYIKSQNDSAIYEVRRSLDGGNTFKHASTANALVPGRKVCECCTADLLASGDSIWLLFRNNNHNIRDIWISRTVDTSDLFTDTRDVDDTDWQINVCPISGPSMTRAGNSIVSCWTSGAIGKYRIYLRSVDAATMVAGTQYEMPIETGNIETQNQAQIAAAGDTIGVVFQRNGRELVFHYAIDGLPSLLTQSQTIAISGHKLQYPHLIFQHGVFYLVYVDQTSGKVLYQRGVLTSNTLIEEAANPAFRFYPNPVVNSDLIVENTTGQLAALQLVNMLGQIVGRQVCTGERTTIPMQTLPTGVYFLVGRNAEGQILSVYKLIKQD
jgi:hypothetical protein